MAEKVFDNLAKQIAENYLTIEEAILEDLKQENREYEKICEVLKEMEKQYPFLPKLSVGQGEMIVSAEEHKIFKEYIYKFFQKDNMERRYIYYRGHTAGYTYLKETGVIKEKKE